MFNINSTLKNSIRTLILRFAVIIKSKHKIRDVIISETKNMSNALNLSIDSFISQHTNVFKCYLDVIMYESSLIMYRYYTC